MTFSLSLCAGGTQADGKDMEVFIGFRNSPLYFSRPEAVISCRDPRQLSSALREVEQAVSRGYYAAGFLSYEAGACFEERFAETSKKGFSFALHGDIFFAKARLPRLS